MRLDAQSDGGLRPVGDRMWRPIWPTKPAGVQLAKPMRAAHCGARSEARRYARNLLRKDKSLTVAVARDAWPFRPGFVDRLCDGLAIAGVSLA
jgi:hypothetical protein